MNPELQTLYVLGTVAVTATIVRVGLESRIRSSIGSRSEVRC